MPSGFRAAAILGSLDAFSVGVRPIGVIVFPDLIRGLTGQSSIGSWWFLDGLGIRFDGGPLWSD